MDLSIVTPVYNESQTIPLFLAKMREVLPKITQDYEIKGYVFMPRTGKKNRVLSDILNGLKRFVAIIDCEVTHRLIPNRRTEYHTFLQLNLNSIQYSEQKAAMTAKSRQLSILNVMGV